MRTVIQRVTGGSVTVDGEKKSISRGLVILAGITTGDTEEDLRWMAEKCINLRIFPAVDGGQEGSRFERSVQDIKGDILAVSQFTLYGECRKGRRPDFMRAAKPEPAKKLYDRFVELLGGYGLKVVTGRFGSMMLVEINNDGPVTLIVDSKKT